MNYIIAGVAAFSLVFLKGFQQQNVTHLHYKSAACIAYGIAAAEVTITLAVVVQQNWWIILPIGTGGAFGIVLAMYSHKRIFGR